MQCVWVYDLSCVLVLYHVIYFQWMLTFYYLLKIFHLSLAFVIYHRFLLKFDILKKKSIHLYISFNVLNLYDCWLMKLQVQNVVPFMLNATFLVYISFIIFDSKGSTFYMIDMNANFSLCMHFLFLKWKGFDGCFVSVIWDIIYNDFLFII
jgi:hypothetical protein